MAQRENLPNFSNVSGITDMSTSTMLSPDDRFRKDAALEGISAALSPILPVVPSVEVTPSSPEAGRFSSSMSMSISTPGDGLTLPFPFSPLGIMNPMSPGMTLSGQPTPFSRQTSNGSNKSAFTQDESYRECLSFAYHENMECLSRLALPSPLLMSSQPTNSTHSAIFSPRLTNTTSNSFPRNDSYYLESLASSDNLAEYSQGLLSDISHVDAVDILKSPYLTKKTKRCPISLHEKVIEVSQFDNNPTCRLRKIMDACDFKIGDACRANKDDCKSWREYGVLCIDLKPKDQSNDSLDTTAPLSDAPDVWSPRSASDTPRVVAKKKTRSSLLDSLSPVLESSSSKSNKGGKTVFYFISVPLLAIKLMQKLTMFELYRDDSIHNNNCKKRSASDGALGGGGGAGNGGGSGGGDSSKPKRTRGGSKSNSCMNSTGGGGNSGVVAAMDDGEEALHHVYIASDDEGDGVESGESNSDDEDEQEVDSCEEETIKVGGLSYDHALIERTHVQSNEQWKWLMDSGNCNGDSLDSSRSFGDSKNSYKGKVFDSPVSTYSVGKDSIDSPSMHCYSPSNNSYSVRTNRLPGIKASKREYRRNKPGCDSYSLLEEELLIGEVLPLDDHGEY